MNMYLNVVECAIAHQEKFLLIKRPKNSYAGGLLSFPGGKVDLHDAIVAPYDILRTAVKREIQEELGINLVDPLAYITSSFFTGQNDIPVLYTLFHCHINQTNLNIITPSSTEVDGYFWLSGEEIKWDDNSLPWLKEYMKAIRTNQK